MIVIVSGTGESTGNEKELNRSEYAEKVALDR